MAVSRARATGSKAIFWLNPARAHDANVIGLANKYLADHDVAGKNWFFFLLYTGTPPLYGSPKELYSIEHWLFQLRHRVIFYLTR